MIELRPHGNSSVKPRVDGDLHPRWLRWVVAAVVVTAVGGACRPRQVTIIKGEDDQSESQWARGVVLYGRHCAGCHGEDGRGSTAAEEQGGGEDGMMEQSDRSSDEEADAPPLVGDDALPAKPRAGSHRQAEFHSARDVFDYARSAMPLMEPGGLGDDRKYWDIVGYLLSEGAVQTGDELTAANASQVKLR